MGELLRKAIRSHESLDDDIHCIGATKSSSGILNLEHRRSHIAGEDRREADGGARPSRVVFFLKCALPFGRLSVLQGLGVLPC